MHRYKLQIHSRKIKQNENFDRFIPAISILFRPPFWFYRFIFALENLFYVRRGTCLFFLATIMARKGKVNWNSRTSYISFRRRNWSPIRCSVQEFHPDGAPAWQFLSSSRNFQRTTIETFANDKNELFTNERCSNARVAPRDARWLCSVIHKTPIRGRASSSFTSVAVAMWCRSHRWLSARWLVSGHRRGASREISGKDRPS